LLQLQADGLGFKVLDEPTANQSDATVLELQLRAVSKKRHGDVAVRSIENAHKSPQEIERWIASIAELHRSKPPAQVRVQRLLINGLCSTAFVQQLV
jgi:intraflagellar transport protein 46